MIPYKIVSIELIASNKADRNASVQVRRINDKFKIRSKRLKARFYATVTPASLKRVLTWLAKGK